MQVSRRKRHYRQSKVMLLSHTVFPEVDVRQKAYIEKRVDDKMEFSYRVIKELPMAENPHLGKNG
jgi:hypothetical protein